MSNYRLMSIEEYTKLWDSLAPEDRLIGEGGPLADKGYKTFHIPLTNEIACCSVLVPHMLRKMIIDVDRGGVQITLSMEMLRLLL